MTPLITNQGSGQGQVATTLDDLYNASLAGLDLQETGGTLTASGAEQVLFITNAPLGNHVPWVVLVDLDNMAALDVLEIRAYYRIVPGGSLKLLDYYSYTGADGGLTNSKKLVAILLYPNRYGMEVTLQETPNAGNHTYDWALFREA